MEDRDLLLLSLLLPLVLNWLIKISRGYSLVMDLLVHPLEVKSVIWNARFGGKFEAIRVQSLHATNNSTKTKCHENIIYPFEKVHKTVAFHVSKILLFI